MKIEKNSTKSNSYFHHEVLFRIPTNDADILPEVDFARMVDSSLL